MVTYCLIGGKSNDLSLNKIEKNIIKLSKKDKPLILFCPFAKEDINKSISRFHDLMKDVSNNIIDLTFENINQFDELLNKSDILYIAGGTCDLLVSIFKKYQLDKILKKYINSDKIYAGDSAGAMLFTKIAMGDKYVYSNNNHNYNYKMVECLGLLNITICPHYNNEDLIIYNDEIKKYDLEAFGIEENSCLVIENNMFYSIKEFKNVSVYYFDKVNHILSDVKENKKYEICSIRS